MTAGIVFSALLSEASAKEIAFFVEREIAKLQI
jgi:hypothetical protein